MDKNSEAFIVVTVILALLVAAPFVIMYVAWAITIQWHWFLEDRFGSLSMTQACGLVLTVGLLSIGKGTSKSTPAWQTISILLFAPLMSLAVGMAIKQMLL